MKAVADHTTEKAVVAVSLDAVFVWLTLSVERDYIERGVFPALRRQNAIDMRGNGSRHIMSIEEVEPVIEDAMARRESASKGLKTSFGAFLRGLASAVEQAQNRPSIYQASEAVCTYKSEYAQDWRGSKAHLQALGVLLEGPWPTEPGSKARRAKGIDKEGRAVRITRYWDHHEGWPCLFEARVEIPQPPVPVRNENEAMAERAIAQANLESMPKDEEDFRWQCIEDVRRWVSCVIRVDAGKTERRYHGFSLTEAAVESILMSLDSVVETIAEAEVTFEEEVHRAAALPYQQQLAALDGAFQSSLAQLTKPDRSILEGRPS